MNEKGSRRGKRRPARRAGEESGARESRDDRSARGRSGLSWSEQGAPAQTRQGQDRRQQNGPPHQRTRGETRYRGGLGKRRDKPGEAPAVYTKNGTSHERLRWTAPRQNTDPLPVPECVRCRQPITDLYSALVDRNSGGTIHFDCALAELAERETLEEGDTLGYIGGGRFGIVHFNKPGGRYNFGEGYFTIKKILEWEEKEHRAEWRAAVADRYSTT